MPQLRQIDNGGTSREIRALVQNDTTGTPRTLAQLWQNDSNGVPRLIFAAFGGSSGSTGVTVAPSDAYGSINSKASLRVTTSGVEGTVGSGTAPFTYLWTFDTGDWLATQPYSASTTFRSPTLAPSESSSAQAFLQVTDANGVVATSNAVNLNASNDGFV